MAIIKTYYHVTLKSNLKSILKKGLEPRIGERSAEIGESEPKVYLFPSTDDMDNALYNWLGEWYCENYGDDVVLASLLVTVPDIFPILEGDVEYEKVSDITIPPEYIKFLKNE